MGYVYGKPQVKRIFGTGDYSEEWIDIRRAKMHDAEALSTGGKRNADILALLIVDWSIVDEQGEKLPISGDVLNELPIEISMPALNYFNEIFLPLTALAVARPVNSKN